MRPLLLLLMAVGIAAILPAAAPAQCDGDCENCPVMMAASPGPLAAPLLRGPVALSEVQGRPLARAVTAPRRGLRGFLNWRAQRRAVIRARLQARSFRAHVH
jgi:hypothetical protein